jgi:hypothetical protein
MLKVVFSFYVCLSRTWMRMVDLNKRDDLLDRTALLCGPWG